MKVIGLIGGMSWESSASYYRFINEIVRDTLGGLHSARSLMYTVDFAEIEQLQHAGKWKEATHILIDAAQRLERGGADFVVLCTNTMHKLADDIQAHIAIPLLHIADATAEKIVAQGIRCVGLLGTRFTMEEDFYKVRLIERYGLEVLIPDEGDREIVHRVIYDELCLGNIISDSKAAYIAIMERLVAQGAQAIISGCTEIGLLVSEQDSPVPFFDTTKIHAIAAVEASLFP